MNALLERELNRRKARGQTPVTLAELKRRLAELGYKLDRSGDASCMARWLTGENANEHYPCTTGDVVEADTGISFAHFQDARRDDNFRKLQELRFNGDLFAVVRGRIFEI